MDLVPRVLKIKLRDAIKSHNQLKTSQQGWRGVSENDVVSQPLTFAIITRQKITIYRDFVPTLVEGGGSGEVGRVSQV